MSRLLCKIFGHRFRHVYSCVEPPYTGYLEFFVCNRCASFEIGQVPQ